MATKIEAEPGLEPSAAPSGESRESAKAPALGQRPNRASGSRGRLGIRGGLLVLTALMLLGLALWWSIGAWAVPRGPEHVSAFGIVEADEVFLSPEVTGRLVALPFRAGDVVRQGDVVARLNDSAIQVQMRQADAATRQQLESQAEKLLLRAPMAGVVTRVPMRVGETAVPGQTVLAIAEPYRLEVVLYVREREIGQVWVGQAVTLVADAFPGQSFAGTVSWVNQRAQFTPRNIQAQRDRQNLVYAVKVEVVSPDGTLKAGLPVEATFSPAPEP